MKRIFLIIILCSIHVFTYAQKTNLWKQVNESLPGKTEELFPGNYKPSSYKLFTLDEAAITSQLTLAPSEEKAPASSSGFKLSVPNADGRIEEFSVVEAPVMQPVLAAKYPNIKSYAGQGINDPSSAIRFDMSPQGFHGMILSANHKTIYINPINKPGKLYAVYYRENASEKDVFKCLINENLTKKTLQQSREKTTNANDRKLRTYRLALVATGEFSQYFLSGTEANDEEKKAKVLASLTTDLVRANAIFERDFGLRLLFVNNEDTLIFLKPKTDPYYSEFNNTTQTVCDVLIGNNHYDIGHVVHKDASNGNAGCIGCVCVPGSKGSGFTMYSKPDITDPFVVDYWIHEMGHQLGANHTFTFNDEGTFATLEPGSGSTIMGYAGITGSTDVQQHSDDYFHAISIQQVMTYIESPQGGGQCVTAISKLNHAPAANAGKNYTIPKSTPFALTGKAADEDGEDVLTYCWEQFDVYSFKNSDTYPKTTSKTGPVFRSVAPTISPVRYFPDLPTILAGSIKNKWEALPAVARNLHFRLTVRDNHITGGSNESDNAVITVTEAAGPFRIESPDAIAPLTSGAKTRIIWKVAQTNLAPVNCRFVNILLSTNGGLSFPLTLAAKTPNDGEQQITLPDIKSKKCRIKVEAAENIFFDISNTDFEIKPATNKQQTESSLTGAITSIQTPVYPNPAHSVLNIYINSTSSKNIIKIYNIYGKAIIIKQAGPGSSQIDIKKLFPGTYMLTMQQPDGKIISNQKFVKE